MEREEFAKLMGDVYSNAMVNMALMFGHELGVFDVLFSTDEPVSLHLIADKANLKERYTQELLSALVAARIIHQDRDSNFYSIPISYKQDLKLLLSVAPQLRAFMNRIEVTQNCFRKDGPYGYVYDDEPSFYDFYHDFRTTFLDHQLDNEIIPFLTENGMIPKLESGIKVLDVGCGAANFTTGFAKMFPNSNFIGLDISEKGLQLARENATKYELSNVEFVKGDCHKLPHYVQDQFDWIFIYDTLHDLYNPHKALDEFYAAIKTTAPSLCLKSVSTATRLIM